MSVWGFGIAIVASERLLGTSWRDFEVSWSDDRELSRVAAVRDFESARGWRVGASFGTPPRDQLELPNLNRQASFEIARIYRRLAVSI
jgi:hypothetical protein